MTLIYSHHVWCNFLSKSILFSTYILTRRNNVLLLPVDYNGYWVSIVDADGLVFSIRVWFQKRSDHCWKCDRSIISCQLTISQSDQILWLILLLLATWIGVGSEILSHFNINILITKPKHQQMYVTMPDLIQGNRRSVWGFSEVWSIVNYT